jgi:hypothetical protein
MARQIWWDRPEGLREAILVIRAYLTGRERLALTRRQLKRATKLLGVHGEGGMWNLSRLYRRRLVLTGLDPDTCEVVDENRWAHAVDYMRETERFRENEFKRWLETHEEPTAVPAVAIPQKPHPGSKKWREERETGMLVSNVVSDRVQNRYFS